MVWGIMGDMNSMLYMLNKNKDVLSSNCILQLLLNSDDISDIIVISMRHKYANYIRTELCNGCDSNMFSCGLHKLLK